MDKNWLTEPEWFYLFRLLLHASAIFAPGPAEREVFVAIGLRTILCYRVETKLTPPYFVHGDLRVGWFPSIYSRQAVHQSLQKLKSRNVLSIRKGGATSIIRIELPGMLSLLSGIRRTQKSMLVHLREKAISFWGSQQWETLDLRMEKETMARLNELNVEEIKERGREHLRAKAMKRRLAPADDVKPSWVFHFIRETCADMNVKYAETLPTMKERQQAKGSARNFLLYCREDGLDPRQIIHDVCFHWHLMRSGELMTAEGKPILLSSVISFMDFFRYRREILKWIGENKDAKPKYEVNIT
jgi:hypothetical protein